MWIEWHLDRVSETLTGRAGIGRTEARRVKYGGSRLGARSSRLAARGSVTRRGSRPLPGAAAGSGRLGCRRAAPGEADEARGCPQGRPQRSRPMMERGAVAPERPIAGAEQDESSAAGCPLPPAPSGSLRLLSASGELLPASSRMARIHHGPAPMGATPRDPGSRSLLPPCEQKFGNGEERPCLPLLAARVVAAASEEILQTRKRATDRTPRYHREMRNSSQVKNTPRNNHDEKKMKTENSSASLRRRVSHFRTKYFVK